MWEKQIWRWGSTQWIVEILKETSKHYDTVSELWKYWRRPLSTMTQSMTDYTEVSYVKVKYYTKGRWKCLNWLQTFIMYKQHESHVYQLKLRSGIDVYWATTLCQAPHLDFWLILKS